MWKRGLFGLLGILATLLIFKVVTVDLRNRQHVVLAMSTEGQKQKIPTILAIQTPEQKQSIPIPSRDETPPPTMPPDSVPIEPPGQPTPPTSDVVLSDNPTPTVMSAVEPARVGVVGDDPMGAVDSFLARNRKEAEDSIHSLTREAEALRARLQKVEAALARWQGFAGALDQGAGPAEVAPANPGPKLRIRWRQPESATPLAPPNPVDIRLPDSGPDAPALPDRTPPSSVETDPPAVVLPPPAAPHASRPESAPLPQPATIPQPR